MSACGEGARERFRVGVEADLGVTVGRQAASSFAFGPVVARQAGLWRQRDDEFGASAVRRVALLLESVGNAEVAPPQLMLTVVLNQRGALGVGIRDVKEHVHCDRRVGLTDYDEAV